jgi:two-component system, OmpR family, response regulator
MGRQIRPAGTELWGPMRWRRRWWSAPLRHRLAERQAPLIVGPAALDVVGRRVIIAGYVVHLPAREAAILEVLMRHAGRVVSLSELRAAIGDRQHREEHVARWVRRLTRRLTVNPLLAPLIESVESAGYRYSPRGTPTTRNPDC